MQSPGSKMHFAPSDKFLFSGFELEPQLLATSGVHRHSEAWRITIRDAESQNRSREVNEILRLPEAKSDGMLAAPVSSVHPGLIVPGMGYSLNTVYCRSEIVLDGR